MKRRRDEIDTILGDRDLRPFWAHRGEAAHRWDLLTREERKAVACMVLECGTTAAAERLKMSVDVFLQVSQYAVGKLGFESGSAFRIFHARQVFAPDPSLAPAFMPQVPRAPVIRLRKPGAPGASLGLGRTKA